MTMIEASPPPDATAAPPPRPARPAPPPRSVYFFGGGRAEGTRDMKAVLGGKGANLAEMTNLGVPVPAGFTIACSVCIEYLRGDGISDALRNEVTQAIRRLEAVTGKKFGDPDAPL